MIRRKLVLIKKFVTIQHYNSSIFVPSSREYGLEDYRGRDGEEICKHFDFIQVHDKMIIIGGSEFGRVNKFREGRNFFIFFYTVFLHEMSFFRSENNFCFYTNARENKRFISRFSTMSD